MSNEDDAAYVSNKVPGRIYGSRSFDAKAYVRGPDGTIQSVARKLRYVDRVLPDSEGDVFAIVKDEVVLRKTATGKRQIKLCVVEDPRGIKTLTLQNFDMSGDADTPSKRAHYVLVGEEIDDLLEIAALARNADFHVSGKFRIGLNQLQRVDISPDAVRQLISTDMLADAMRNELTERDVVAVAYRKAQLGRFQRLLEDANFFSAEQANAPNQSAEAVWQQFFEDNHWIFGGTLFLNSAGAFDPTKLEVAVSGASVAMHGKRVDALLRTRGRIGALCFVEIKTHSTPLLKSAAYRPGAWAPSDHLSGAVSQLQRTIQLAEQTIGEKLSLPDPVGNPVGPPAYLMRPRAAVICGDLSQFMTAAGGVNEDKYSSFELFRRHLQSPEIVTFDELLERARLMVET